MSEIKLKSAATAICDYRSIDIERFAIPLQADPIRYEQDLTNFRKRFAQKVEPDSILAQDMVTLSCSSRNPKFQKNNLMLRVGLCLYSKELEAQLIGLHRGEQKALSVGVDTVTVSIEKIVRELLPALTDALAAQSGLPDVKTAEDIRTLCRGKQYDERLEDPADEAFAYLAGQSIQNSVYRLDAEELAAIQAVTLAMLNENSNLGGTSFDALSEEDAVSKFGISKQALVAQMRQTGEYTLKAAVLGQTMRTLTTEDYEAYLGKRAVAEELSDADARRKYSLTDYMIQTFSDHYLDVTEQYVYRKLKEVGEWKARSNQKS